MDTATRNSFLGAIPFTTHALLANCPGKQVDEAEADANAGLVRNPDSPAPRSSGDPPPVRQPVAPSGFRTRFE
jgi:hypothetical protein